MEANKTIEEYGSNPEDADDILDEAILGPDG